MSRLTSMTPVSTARTAGDAGSNQFDHPRRVDPRPPHDQQQEGRAGHAVDREVVQDQVRQLRDREDVDQVEEQLDRRDRLLDAVAARAQVACRWSSRASRHQAVQEQRRADARGGGRGRGARARSAPRWRPPRSRREPRSAMTGTATTTARISSGGQTSSPRKMTTATSATRRPPAVDLGDLRAHLDGVGCPVCGGRTSVVFMTATLPERAAHVVRVGPQSHPQSA